MRRLLMLIALPSIALGQWQTNWPASDYPRQGYSQMGQLYSGAVERCNAAGKAIPMNPTNYRSAYDAFVDMKAKVEAAVWFYIEPPTNGVSFDGQMEGVAIQNGEPSTEMTPTSVLTNNFLATNFFHHTFYRGMSGLGGLTNGADYAALGHMHGWTNAITADGGTCFASNRTVFYTTDYGLDGMKAVLNDLEWTGDVCGWLSGASEGEVVANWANVGDTNETAHNHYYAYSSTNEPSTGWNDLTTWLMDLNNHWPTPSGIGKSTREKYPYTMVYGYYRETPGSSTGNVAYAATSRNRLSVPLETTNYTCDVHFYTVATSIWKRAVNSPIGWPAVTNTYWETYDSAGLVAPNVDYGWFLSWITNNAFLIVTSAPLGQLERPIEWCNQPSATNGAEAKGFVLTNQCSCAWWAQTNGGGFAYVE